MCFVVHMVTQWQIPSMFACSKAVPVGSLLYPAISLSSWEHAAVQFDKLEICDLPPATAQTLESDIKGEFWMICLCSFKGQHSHDAIRQLNKLTALDVMKLTPALIVEM